jgi:hypothetical protein
MNPDTEKPESRLPSITADEDPAAACGFRAARPAYYEAVFPNL